MIVLVFFHYLIVKTGNATADVFNSFGFTIGSSASQQCSQCGYTTPKDLKKVKEIILQYWN